MLFDTGATHSFVASGFAQGLDMTLEKLSEVLWVLPPTADPIPIEHVYRNCEVKIRGHHFSADLHPLDMYDFDAIPGMDWLERHHALGDFVTKEIVFRWPDGNLQRCESYLPFMLHLLHGGTTAHDGGADSSLTLGRSRKRPYR